MRLIFDCLTDQILFQRFSENHMKATEGKCHVFLLSHSLSTNQNILVNKGATQRQKSSCEKLLEIKIDSKLNLKDHTGDTCKKNQCQNKSFDHSLRLHESNNYNKINNPCHKTHSRLVR